MATCPNCGHDPRGISSNWMWIYRCADCGKYFCHRCVTTTGGGVRCAGCDSDNTAKDHKCYTEA